MPHASAFKMLTPVTADTSSQTTSTTDPMVEPANRPMAAEINRMVPSTSSLFTWKRRAVPVIPFKVLKVMATPSFSNHPTPAVAPANAAFPPKIAEILAEILPKYLDSTVFTVPVSDLIFVSAFPVTFPLKTFWAIPLKKSPTV